MALHIKYTTSKMLRYLMIDYADRGLVLNGRPNLHLFNQLYWILFCTYTAILIGPSQLWSGATLRI